MQCTKPIAIDIMQHPPSSVANTFPPPSPSVRTSRVASSKIIYASFMDHAPFCKQQHRSFALTLVAIIRDNLSPAFVVTIKCRKTKTGMGDSEAKGHALMAEARAKLQKSTGFLAFFFGCGSSYLSVASIDIFHMTYDSCSRSHCALENHFIA